MCGIINKVGIMLLKCVNMYKAANAYTYAYTCLYVHANFDIVSVYIKAYLVICGCVFTEINTCIYL